MYNIKIELIMKTLKTLALSIMLVIAFGCSKDDIAVEEQNSTIERVKLSEKDDYDQNTQSNDRKAKKPTSSNTVKITFVTGTTQSQMNAALGTVNYIHTFTCVDSDPIVIAQFDRNIGTDGRSIPYNGNGDSDDVDINSLPNLQHFKLDGNCFD